MADRPLVRLPVRASDGFTRRAQSWAEVLPADVVAVRPYEFGKDGEARSRIELAHGRPVECLLRADEVLDLLWPDA